MKLLIPRVWSFSRDAQRSATGSAARLTKSPRRALAVAAVLFLVGQAGFNLAVRQEWLPIRDPVYSEKIAVYRDRPDAPLATIRVLALGSSRTHLGFDASRYAGSIGPEVEAFNFGCPAAGPVTSALYFRRLLGEGVRPDALLIEAHPGFLTPMHPPFEAQWLRPYRLRADEAELLREFGWDPLEPAQHDWQSWVGAGSTYRFAVLNRYAPVLLPTPFGLTVGSANDRFGYVAGIDLPTGQRPRALERSLEQYRAVFEDYRIGGPGPAAIRDMLRRAAAHNIRAAVLLPPESSTFRGWYGPRGNEAISRFMDEVAEEFHVPVFNAREWVPDDGFADGHHLTPTGGAAFTDRLALESALWVRAR